VGDVDRMKDFHCAIVLGNRKAHQVRSISCQDPTMLENHDTFVSVLIVRTPQHPSHVNMYIHILLSSLMCLISMHKCSLQVS
jgi:hypothetical protein